MAEGVSDWFCEREKTGEFLAMDAFLAGFLLGMSLIMAIGAQNAFLLRQGLKREHLFVLCLLCASSDAVLITFGVFGISYISSQLASLLPFIRYGGAFFLFCYGAASFWRAWKNREALIAAGQDRLSLRASVMTCLAFTWLNPHVYLDTVLLLGSVSSGYPQQRCSFALGAILASFCFFFALGYGARLLAPLFRKPSSWRILECGIGCVMWWLSCTLLFGELGV